MTPPARRIPWILAALLAASLALRVLLCAGGGQYFFGDEARYDRGPSLYLALASGDAHQVRALAGLPEHALFPWLGAAVTLGQRVLAAAVGRGDWAHHPERLYSTMWIAASILSLASVASILLVWVLARRLGAGAAAALWAAALMAASNTEFYYARHLLPYDAALAAALLGAVVGAKAPTRARAFAAGALCAVAYHLYNGYWFLAPSVAAVLHVAWPRTANRAAWAAFVAGGIGTGVSGSTFSSHPLSRSGYVDVDTADVGCPSLAEGRPGSAGLTGARDGYSFAA